MYQKYNEVGGLIHLAENRDQWQVLVNMKETLGLHKIVENSSVAK
jgi:hypothetical protein